MRTALVGAAVTLVAAAPPPPQALEVRGPGGVVVREDAAALARATPVAAAALRGKDGETVQYRGPALFAVLDAAHVVSGDMRQRAHQTVLITGRDGYASVLSLAEVDPAFEGEQVVLATSGNGQALALPRLVVAGDRAHARDVRDVVLIEVR